MKKPLLTSSAEFTGDVLVGGNLTVSGTTTSIDTANLVIEDKNIVLANAASPTNTGADGGGITLKASTDKTIIWNSTNDSWGLNCNVDVQGNVGIGTTNPTANLHIVGDGSVANRQGFIRISNNVNGEAGIIGDSIALMQGGAAGQLAIRSGSAGIVFGVAASPKMIIDSGGNVGIGTTNPRAKFEVADASTNSALLFNVGGNSKASIQSVDEDQILNTRPLTLNPAGGNVGIGTTNPNAKLDVSTATNTHGLIIRETTTDEITHNLYIDSPGNGTVAYYAAGQIKKAEIKTLGDSYFNGGNVGIGTASPGCILTVRKEEDTLYNNITPSVGSCALSLINNPTSSQQVGFHTSLQFNLNAGTHNHVGSISLVSETSTMRRAALTFCTDDGSTRPEAMRIDSDGNVGIGSTNPGSKLDVIGYAKVGRMHIDSDYSIQYFRKTDATALGWLLMRDDATNQLAFPKDQYIHISHQGDFNNNGLPFSKDRIVIDTNGNVGIGTTDPEAPLAVGNGGKNIEMGWSNGAGANYIQSYDRTNSGFLDLIINNSATFAGNGNVGIGGTVDSMAGWASPKTLQIKSPDTFSCINLQGTYGGNNSNYTIGAGSGKLYLGYNQGVPASGHAIIVQADGAVHMGGETSSGVGVYRLYVVGSINASGDVYNSGSALTSDDRLKHNEKTIVGALDTLAKITPKKYIKTTEMYDADHDFELDADGNPVDEDGELVKHSIEAGIIAQEALTVDELAFAVKPETVDENGDVISPHYLDYNSLFTYAIAAIQELKQEIDELKDNQS